MLLTNEGVRMGRMTDVRDVGSKAKVGRIVSKGS